MSCKSPASAAAGLLGDINGDNVVDAADYIILKQNLGRRRGCIGGGCCQDLDSNGTVGIGDLDLLAGTGANAAGGAAVTPEPATLALLAFGGLAVIRRRKQH